MVLRVGVLETLCLRKRKMQETEGKGYEKQRDNSQAIIRISQANE